ncbi:MAG TPA: M20/M25/M40 family metallo-hydrolase [Terriglobales bacterium]|nr:M20/M25/M40 family metallo-hydrolase [Terriglobales bacterium]
MRPAIVALFSLSFANLLFSQMQNPIATTQLKPLSPELRNQLIALRDAALNDEYTYEQTAHLTDNIGPRPVGSVQAQGAVEYVADQLRRLGLDVQLEEIKVPHWIRGTETAELVDYPGQIPGVTQKIVLTALGGTVPTSPSGVTAEVVVARSFEDLTTLGRDKVAGKIVLLNFPFDKKKATNGLALEAYEEAVAYRSRGPKAAAELGAAACLIRSVGGADYRLPHTGFSVPAGIPAAAVTSEDGDLIARLAAQGRIHMHLTLTSETGPDTISYNVIGDLKGGEHPEQVVIVSGHLDSWDLGTGALDDATGVAVAMETAHLVQQLHLHSRRTIRVIAWMDEENGGRGRAAYAKEHAAELPNHCAALESDLGAAHPFGFEAKISPDALPLLKPVQEILQSFGANLIHLTARSPAADIALLAQAGVPAFGIMQDGRTYFNYHHTAADTLDKIEPRELRENAAAMAVMGYALANLPEPLPR